MPPAGAGGAARVRGWTCRWAGQPKLAAFRQPGLGCMRSATLLRRDVTGAVPPFCSSSISTRWPKESPWRLVGTQALSAWPIPPACCRRRDHRGTCIKRASARRRLASPTDHASRAKKSSDPCIVSKHERRCCRAELPVMTEVIDNGDRAGGRPRLDARAGFGNRKRIPHLGEAGGLSAPLYIGL